MSFNDVLIKEGQLTCRKWEGLTSQGRPVDPQTRFHELNQDICGKTPDELRLQASAAERRLRWRERDGALTVNIWGGGAPCWS